MALLLLLEKSAPVVHPKTSVLGRSRKSLFMQDSFPIWKDLGGRQKYDIFIPKIQLPGLYGRHLKISHVTWGFFQLRSSPALRWQSNRSCGSQVPRPVQLHHREYQNVLPLEQSWVSDPIPFFSLLDLMSFILRSYRGSRQKWVSVYAISIS